MNRVQGRDQWLSLCQAQAFVFNFAPADAGRHCRKVMEVSCAFYGAITLHTEPLVRQRSHVLYQI